LLLKNESQAAQVGDGVKLLVDFFLAEGEFVFEQAGFERGDAAEAPAGERHGLDQVHFDYVDRLVGVEVGLAEFGEVLFGLAGDDEVGGHAVLEGVAGGVLFALRSDGAAGFFAVLAGGVRF
jgi:hypothetical protein